MDVPQTSVWGPALWMLLHSSAERWGTKRLSRLADEETRLWLNLLQSLRFSLPCPLCKKHYQSYLSSHPFSASTKEEVRLWLYRLHQSVNERRRIIYEASMEELEQQYAIPFAFSVHATVVVQQMRLSLRRGLSHPDDIRRTIRYLEEFKRFYDFF
jgi:hypothetical protein